MAHKPNLLLNIAASVAVTAILAAFAAWVVCRYYPRPFFSAYWPCLGGALFLTMGLVTCNVIEAIVAGGMVLVLAVVSIPICTRLQVPAIPAHVLASVASGMLSSRVLRKMESDEW